VQRAFSLVAVTGLVRVRPIVRAADTFVGTRRFAVERCLGVGGMGVVYRAFDRDKQRRVAVKVLGQVDAGGLARFKREFRAAQQIVHPNVVSLGELYEADGAWFFTMELIEGGHILDYIWGRDATVGREATIPAAEVGFGTALTAEAALGGTAVVRREPRVEALDWPRLRGAMGQLVRGLAALHQAGMVHRDVKPANILVTAEGRTVVTDFGLVSMPGVSVSTAGTVRGTIAYMAPEQALGEAVGPEADWYAVGTVLYEALTGRLPFEGAHLQLMMQKLQAEPPPPSSMAPDVPSDLDDLCMALLRRDPRQRPVVTEIAKALGDAEPVARAGEAAIALARPRSVFVGRRPELGQLEAALAAVGDRPVVLRIDGESGVGKSALVEHFVERAAAADPRVLALRGRCYEREQVPFNAFDGVADALVRLLVHMPAAQLAAVLPVHAGLLGQLFPAFARVEAIAKAATGPRWIEAQTQRARTFDAFRDLLARLAQNRRLIVIVDDLQWADPDSLALFEELFDHEDAPAALVVVMSRPLDEERRTQALRALGAAGPLRALALGRLPEAESRELAGALLGGAGDLDLDALVRESGGHPLFVRELALHAGDGARGVSLDAALRARIAGLSAEARQVLGLLCVADRPIALSIAVRASALEPLTFDRATATLRLAHLVSTDGSRGLDTIAPYHDRVREVGLASLGDDERRAAHAGLADALERNGGDPHTVVRHAQAAGQRDRAARHAAIAAEAADHAMAFDQAAGLYETALAFGAPEPSTRLRLLEARAEALKSAGRAREAAEAFMQAADAAEQSPTGQTRCRTEAVAQWILAGHLDEGFAAGASLLASIGEPAARSPGWALASLLWNRARLRLTATVAGPRREGAVDAVDHSVLARLDVLRAVAMGLTGTDLVRSSDFNVRFLRHARRAGEPVRLAQGLGIEACFLAAQGGRGARRVVALVEEMASIAARFPDDAYLANYVTGVRGIVALHEGDFVIADALLAQSEHGLQLLPHGNTLERNTARQMRAHALRLAGRVSLGLEIGGARLRDAQRRGDLYFVTTLRTYATHDLLARDRVDEVSVYLAQAPWHPLERGAHLQHYLALEAEGELALYLGRAETLVPSLAQRIGALRRALLLRIRLIRVLVGWLHARTLLASAGRGSDLRPVMRLARQLAGERVGYASVYAGLVQAALAFQGGDPSTAVARLREAVTSADRHSMANCAAAARHRLGRLVGGSEGAALRDEALAWAEQERIIRPERYFELVAPGFDDVAARGANA
jgi:hypothetical protein